MLVCDSLIPTVLCATVLHAQVACKHMATNRKPTKGGLDMGLELSFQEVNFYSPCKTWFHALCVKIITPH